MPNVDNGTNVAEANAIGRPWPEVWGPDPYIHYHRPPWDGMGPWYKADSGWNGYFMYEVPTVDHNGGYGITRNHRGQWIPKHWTAPVGDPNYWPGAQVYWGAVPARCDQCRATEMVYSPQRVTEIWCYSCGYRTYNPRIRREELQRERAAAREQRRRAAELRQMARVPHILRWNERPAFKMFGEAENGLFFGFENELEIQYEADHVHTAFTVEGGRLRREDIPAIIDKLNGKAKQLVYCKSDGSIRDGIEFVTMPMSFEYIMDKFPEKVYEFWAAAMNNHVDGAHNCGMHVHMSRAAFGKPYHLYKFLQFVYSFPEFMCQVAGRGNGPVGDIGTMYSYRKEDVGTLLTARKGLLNPQDSYIREMSRGKTVNRSRYVAANAWSGHDQRVGPTIELRVFKATTNRNRIRANIQFCDALFYYTKSARLTSKYNKLREMNPDNFKLWLIATEERQARYEDLINLLNGVEGYDTEVIPNPMPRAGQPVEIVYADADEDLFGNDYDDDYDDDYDEDFEYPVEPLMVH